MKCIALLAIGISMAGCAEQLMPVVEVAEIPPRKRKPECHDQLIGDDAVVVRCSIWDWADALKAKSMARQLAAEGALRAGKTHALLTASERKPITKQRQTPVKCSDWKQTTASKQRRFFAALGGAGDINCTTSGDQTRCHNNPPMPEPEYMRECKGGETWTTIERYEIVSEYRLMTAEEAEPRDSELLPSDKRPIDARAVLAPPEATKDSTESASPAPAD